MEGPDQYLVSLVPDAYRGDVQVVGAIVVFCDDGVFVEGTLYIAGWHPELAHWGKVEYVVGLNGTEETKIEVGGVVGSVH